MIAVLRRVLYAETLLLSPTVFVFLTIITIFLTALLSYLFPLTPRPQEALSRGILGATEHPQGNGIKGNYPIPRENTLQGKKSISPIRTR